MLPNVSHHAQNGSCQPAARAAGQRATSTIHYRGQQFDAPDPVLEVWLRLLVDAVSELPHIPAWLAEARDDWQALASEEFGFGVGHDVIAYARNAGAVTPCGAAGERQCTCRPERADHQYTERDSGRVGIHDLCGARPADPRSCLRPLSQRRPDRERRSRREVQR
jgi:hypothetical protein